ncbi:hypothetical protein FHX15_002027 [Rhizobium sp. BK650]|nr:hypothetical protein [Rhizobium sp. BK650]
MVFFRYSKVRYSRGRAALAAIASQSFAIAFLVLMFRSISTYSAASTHSVSEFVTAIVGFEIGLFYAVLAWPLTVRRAMLVFVVAVAFAAFYWAVSPEPEDRWLAQIIAGAGVGLLSAVAFRWRFFTPPAFPRVR